MKCNPDVEVVKTLAGLGANFDCASRGEIDQVLSIGVTPDRIIYANPCKQISHLRAAAARGVELMTFDSGEELMKIATYHSGGKLVLRLMVDDSAAMCVFSNKFGAPMDQVPDLLRLAKSLGLDVVGVSFHVGSGCMDARAYDDAVQRCRSAWDTAAELGIKMNLLDLGGGFPGVDPEPQTPAEREAAAAARAQGLKQPVSFSEIAAVLRASLDRLFPPSLGARIIAEPGRYYVAASHALAVCVTGVKMKKNKTVEGGPPQYAYYVNDGLYSSFNSVMYDHAVLVPKPLVRPDGPRGLRTWESFQSSVQAVARNQPMLVPVGRAEADATQSGDGSASAPATVEADKGAAAPVEEFESSMWGPTCDGLDCLFKARKLPLLQRGDWLYFGNQGAYTSAGGSEFNGFARSSKIYINTELVRGEGRSSEEELLGPARMNYAAGLWAALPALPAVAGHRPQVAAQPDTR